MVIVSEQLTYCVFKGEGMRGGVVLAGTIVGAAVVVKLVHDMQQDEKREMRAGVEVRGALQRQRACWFCHVIPVYTE